MQHKIRVLLLMERLVTGGAELSFLRMLRHHPTDLLDLHVGVLLPGGDLEQDFVALGVPIVPFYRKWRFDLSPMTRIARYCEQQQIEIVHAMLWLSGVFAALAARRVPGLQAIGSTLQEVYDTQKFGAIRATIDRALAPRMDAMVVNSVYVRHYLAAHQYPLQNVVIVPNGITIPDCTTAATLRDELRQRYAIAPDAPCVGMLARLSPAKDQATLLRAAKIVRQRFPTVRFLIAGEGSERAALEALSASLGLGEQVIFTGRVPEAAAIMPAWDVAAHASRHEGLPNVIQEALAWGKPVVATRIAGIPEIITEGENGYLIPVGDAETFAQRIGELLADPARAQAMGATGRQRAIEEWSTDRMVAHYLNLYLRLKQRQEVVYP